LNPNIPQQYMSAQEKLLQAAVALGLQATDLTIAWSQAAIRLSKGDQEEVIFDGTGFGATPLLATTICNDLPILRHYLAALEIPSPRGVVFKLDQEHTSKEELTDILGDFWHEGKIYTLRPAFDTSGNGVASNLRRLDDVEMHLDTFADEFATWILEEQVEGEDLQMLVIGGKLAAAILRSPLKLKGDGTHTLEELIDAHNLLAKPSDRVEINAETRQLLRDQAVFLSEIVPSGQWVQLKNPGAGAGGATDVTTRLHAGYAAWATQLSAHAGLAHYTIHARCSAIDADPAAAAWVMGIDPRPDWLAFEHAEGSNQGIATLLLQAIFKLG
jgi:hypothetical protein